jgi:hypothetical protein
LGKEENVTNVKTSRQSSPRSHAASLLGFTSLLFLVAFASRAAAQVLDGLPICAPGWDSKFGVDGPRGLSADVRALSRHGPDLVVGGHFNEVGPDEMSVGVKSLAMWNPTNGVWSDVAGGVTASNGITPGQVAGLATFDGSLWVAGTFNLSGGVENEGVARWDATNGWQKVDFGAVDITHSQFVGTALAVFNGGLYLAGVGPAFNCSAAVYQWNPQTSSWVLVGNGWTGAVPFALGADGGVLYVGGDLIAACGTQIFYQNSGRLSGGSWVPLVDCFNRTGASIPVFAISTFNDKVYFGGLGAFSEVRDCKGDSEWGSLQIWDPVRSDWSQLWNFFAGGNVFAMSTWDDGDSDAPGPKLFVAGTSLPAPDVGTQNIFRYTGTEGLAMGSGVNGTARSVLRFHDGQNESLIVGGHFSLAGGHSVRNIARWGRDQSCYADFNNDGVVNIFDFLAFQAAMTSGDLRADCNCDGMLNIFDFLWFQAQVQAGCS